MQVDGMVSCDGCGDNVFTTDDYPPENWHSTEEHDLCPPCLEDIKAGVAALNEGRVTPWEDVERELDK